MNSFTAPSASAATVASLRQRLGARGLSLSSPATGSLAIRPAEISCRPGTITEWLAAGSGQGAETLAAVLCRRAVADTSLWAIVDASREFYAPAAAGWGLDPARLLLLRPRGRAEMLWATEQCLRCRAVAATWVWAENIDERTLRRWQLAAEASGSLGMVFRPEQARREPAWADQRLLVTPEVGIEGESRRVRVEVLYRRGGFGSDAQVWEIDHAAGVVHLVPQLAHPTAARRALGA